MQVVTAPTTLYKPSVFLAGSISQTWDWQEYFIKSLIAKNIVNLDIPLTIFNPRRSGFDVTNPAVEKEQIEWEERHLRIADAIVFWFAEETLAPITLFELGRHSVIAGKDLFIGVHPNYKRKRDVFIQLGITRPTMPIHESVDSLADIVSTWAKYKDESY